MRLPSVSPLPYFLLIFFAVASAASAHHLPPGMEDVDEFADGASFLMGFNHPLTGLDHLAAALLTGVVASRFGKSGPVAILSGALGALMAGWAAAGAGLILPAGDAMLLASVVAALVVFLFPSPARLRIGAGAVLAFQVWHGSSHAMATPFGVSRGPYAAGVFSAMLLTMVMGLLLARFATRWFQADVGKRQIA